MSEAGFDASGTVVEETDPFTTAEGEKIGFSDPVGNGVDDGEFSIQLFKFSGFLLSFRLIYTPLIKNTKETTTNIIFTFSFYIGCQLCKL